jgi:hypothetical protein
MEWKTYPPGQEREILTTVSEPCSQMMCEKCPGIINKDRDVSEWVFCVHECHQARNRDRTP